MPIIYWCCSRERFTLVSNGCCLTLKFDSCQLVTTLQWRVISYVKSPMSPDSQSLFCFKGPCSLVLYLSVSCFQAPELISWALRYVSHMTLSNISPFCSVQQPAPCSLQISLKWLSQFPWKPGAQRSGKIYFALQQRDKEMVRQRESRRKRGLKRESGGSLTLKDASLVYRLCLGTEWK